MNVMSESISIYNRNVDYINKAMSPYNSGNNEFQSQISLIDKYNEGPYPKSPLEESIFGPD